MTINFRYWKTRVVRYPLLALGASAALVVTGLNRGLGKSDWAAWVQAIGSIAAIVGAYQISNRQHNRDLLADEHRRKLDDARKIKIIQAFIRKASVKSYELIDADRCDRFDEIFFFKIEALKESTDALNSILPMDYPNAELALSATIVKRHLSEMIDLWEKHRARHTSAFEYVEDLRANNFSEIAVRLDLSTSGAFRKTQEILGET